MHPTLRNTCQITKAQTRGSSPDNPWVTCNGTRFIGRLSGNAQLPGGAPPLRAHKSLYGQALQLRLLPPLRSYKARRYNPQRPQAKSTVPFMYRGKDLFSQRCPDTAHAGCPPGSRLARQAETQGKGLKLVINQPNYFFWHPRPSPPTLTFLGAIYFAPKAKKKGNSPFNS